MLFSDVPDNLIPTTRTYERLLDAIERKNLKITLAEPRSRYDLAEHDGSVQVGAVEEDVPLLQKADNLSMRMTVGIVLAKLRDEGRPAPTLEKG